MHHFSKLHKRLWYHIALSLGSALLTVALFDTLCSLSWLCKDYEIVAHYTGEEDNTTPINIMDIMYWIFVSYRMILSLVICIGGIFMGRRIIVIVWLVVSLSIDLIHLSETVFVLSKPNLMSTWPIVVAVSSGIWQELKIVRIKYRVIRRSLLVDTNNNNHNDEDQELEHKTFRKEIESHRTLSSLISATSSNLVAQDVTNIRKRSSPSDIAMIEPHAVQRKSSNMSHYVAANTIHFIKLVRNLYNLLTWHFTGYLFGGDYQHLISSNYKATILEESFIRYARIFMDVLTVIYIVQEKRMLLTPWIMAYIMTASATIAVFLFTLLHMNLLTTLFASIYYLVFSMDLFFRFSFLIFLFRYVLQTKVLV